jgi:hypothetical protein
VDHRGAVPAWGFASSAITSSPSATRWSWATRSAQLLARWQQVDESAMPRSELVRL